MELTSKSKESKKTVYGTYVLGRIRKNKNFLCAITGPTGSGKTYSALRLAQSWDENFTVDNIVFTVESFISLINEGNLKSGSVILFEEAGVAMNNRKWQSLENGLIQFVLQTFRHKNYIVIFTAPDFGFIDSASRKLMHAHFMTVGIDFETKHCNIKPYLLQINQRSAKIYYKFLKVDLAGVGRKKVSSLAVELPSKELIKDYEKRKNSFTTELNDKIQEQLMAKLQNKREKDIAQNVEEQKMANITVMRGDGKSWKEIAKIYDSTETGISKWYNRRDSLNK